MAKARSVIKNAVLNPCIVIHPRDLHEIAIFFPPSKVIKNREPNETVRWILSTLFRPNHPLHGSVETRVASSIALRLQRNSLLHRARGLSSSSGFFCWKKASSEKRVERNCLMFIYSNETAHFGLVLGFFFLWSASADPPLHCLSRRASVN